MGGKIILHLKLVKIMLESWKLVCKYTHICSFRKNTFYYPKGCLNFTDSAFFIQKISIFGKTNSFTQSNSESCAWVFLVLFSILVSLKIFVSLNRCWQLRGLGVLNESVKKGKFVTEIFFSNNVEWGCKNLLKVRSADEKSNKKNKK